MDSQNHNSANLALLKSLLESGAKPIFKVTLPDHRLPTWNNVLEVGMKEKLRIKANEKKRFSEAFDSASLFTPIEPD